MCAAITWARSRSPAAKPRTSPGIRANSRRNMSCRMSISRPSKWGSLSVIVYSSCHLSWAVRRPHVEVDVQAGEGELSLGEEGGQCWVELVRVGPRDVVRSAVQGDHPDGLDDT